MSGSFGSEWAPRKVAAAPSDEVVESAGEADAPAVRRMSRDNLKAIYNLKVGAGFHAWLKESAASRGLTMSAFIHESLERHLDDVEPEHKIVLGIRLEIELYERLRAVSKEIGVPMTRLVEKAVRMNVDGKGEINDGS